MIPILLNFIFIYFIIISNLVMFLINFILYISFYSLSPFFCSYQFSGFSIFNTSYMTNIRYQGQICSSVTHSTFFCVIVTIILLFILHLLFYKLSIVLQLVTAIKRTHFLTQSYFLPQHSHKYIQPHAREKYIYIISLVLITHSYVNGSTETPTFMLVMKLHIFFLEICDRKTTTILATCVMSYADILVYSKSLRFAKYRKGQV